MKWFNRFFVVSVILSYAEGHQLNVRKMTQHGVPSKPFEVHDISMHLWKIGQDSLDHARKEYDVPPDMRKRFHEMSNSTDDAWMQTGLTRRLENTTLVMPEWSDKLAAIAAAAVLVPVSATPCYMMGTGGGRQLQPPSWGPEMARSYPFRTYARDVLIWSVAVADWDPSRKAAALCMKLTGAALSFSRQLPPAALIQGGRVNGVAMDPLTYLIHSLSERFGMLGEESIIGSMSDLMTFQRQRGEDIDTLLTRFDEIRQRARDQGIMIMNVQGLSWLLLRACGVTNQQLIHLLTPLLGQFPATDQQLDVLFTGLRRMGHILEHAPGNLATALQGGGAPAGAFFMDGQDDADGWQADADNWTQQQYAAPAPAWGGQTTWQQDVPENQVALLADQDFDSGTDSDTASSEGNTQYELEVPPEIANHPGAVAQHLFWAYERAKRAWRSYMQKPVRRVRRFLRRKGKGTGKGQAKYGKGKGSVPHYLASLDGHQAEQLFAAFRRKGKGKGNISKGKGQGQAALMSNSSTGKGRGRKTNPRGPDGRIMECHGCGATDHLIANCPNRGTTAHLAADATSTSTALPSNGQMVALSSPLDGIMPAASRPGQLIFMVNSDASSSFTSGWERIDPSLQPSTSSQVPVHTDPWWTGADPWAQNPVRVGSQSSTIPQQQQPEEFQQQIPRFPFAYEPDQATSSNQTTAERQQHVPPGFSTPNRQEDQYRGGHYGSPYQTTEIIQPEYTMWPEVLANNTILQPPQHAITRPMDQNITSEHQQLLDALHGTNNRSSENYRTYQAPIPQTRSTPANDNLYDDMHRTQQAGRDIAEDERRRRGKGRGAKAKGKGQGPPPSEAESQAFSETEYDGMTDTCSICLENFDFGISMIRLACHHLFHAECWTSQLVADERPYCPNCRGPGRVIARFRFVVTGNVTPRARGRSEFSTPNSHRSAEESFPNVPVCCSGPNGCSDSRRKCQCDHWVCHAHSYAQVRGNVAVIHCVHCPGYDPDNMYDFRDFTEEQTRVFPWWCGMANTELENEPFSILVDPGAFTNLCGLNWARRAAKWAMRHGLQPDQERMVEPMNVHGVGNGSHTADWRLHLPVAITDSTDDTSLHSYQAPIVGGTGSHLPALYGLGSMQEKKAILCTDPDGPLLIFPGNEPPRFEFGPGAMLIPLRPAPSGHLCMPAGDFTRLNQNGGGLRRPQINMLAAPPGQMPQPMAEQDDDQQQQQEPRQPDARSPAPEPGEEEFQR